MLGMFKKEAVWARLREAFLIAIGLALYGCAWNMFILPQGFVGGGFGGLCAMFYYLTGVPIFVSYLIINIGLCGIAFLILGQEFSIKTVFGILGLVFFLAIIPVPESPIINDKLLSGIMGGIIAGAGVGTYLLQGASTGGSDIVVVIISKYKNVSWGKIYLIFDACVISSSIFLPGRTLETVAYGFVFMGVSAYVIDLVHSGMKQSVQMLIFTSKYEEIANEIINVHRRGVTLLESIGFYTKQQSKTIYLVARKRETQSIFRSVKQIDENAFIVVSNAMSVFGMGFDAIKAGFTKDALKGHKQFGAKVIKADGSGTFTVVSNVDEVAAHPDIIRDEVESCRLDELGLMSEYESSSHMESSSTGGVGNQEWQEASLLSALEGEQTDTMD